MPRIGPLDHDPMAPLARRHPLARIGAAVVLMLGLFVSVDPVTPAAALAGVMVAAALSGIEWRGLARRAVPLAVGALGIGAFNALAAGDASAGLAVGLRLVAIAFAGVVALATIDPTDLADGLVQHLKAPPRFAIGALAAARMFPLFAREWEIRGLARRARGFEDRRGGLAAFPSRVHGLLVAAIRRAVVLALAMDARGFGSRDCRTISRPRRFDQADIALVVAATIWMGAAIALSVTVGTWRPLGG